MMKEDEYIEQLGRRCAHNINAEIAGSTKRWVGLPWRSVVEEFLFAANSRIEIQEFLVGIGCPGDLSYTLKHCLNKAIIDAIANRVEFCLLDARRMDYVVNNTMMSRPRQFGKSVAMLVAAGFVPCDFFVCANTDFELPPAWSADDRSKLTQKNYARVHPACAGSETFKIENWSIKQFDICEVIIRDHSSRELDWDWLSIGMSRPVIAWMDTDGVCPLVMLCEQKWLHRSLNCIQRNSKAVALATEFLNNPLFGTW